MPHPFARWRAAPPGRRRRRAAACIAAMRLPSAPRSSSSGSRPARAHAAPCPPSAPAGAQPAAERARHHRQHGVVHGPAERVLDLLEVGQRLCTADAPVRADQHVERHVRRRVHPRPHDFTESLCRLARLLDRPARPPRGVERASGQLNGVRTSPSRPPPPAPRRTARRGGPSVVRGRLRRRRLGIEQHRGDVHARDPVQRVVRLRDQREPASVEALHEPHPERLRTIEPREDAAHELPELLVEPGREGQWRTW